MDKIDKDILQVDYCINNQNQFLNSFSIKNARELFTSTKNRPLINNARVCFLSLLNWHGILPWKPTFYNR